MEQLHYKRIPIISQCICSDFAKRTKMEQTRYLKATIFFTGALLKNKDKQDILNKADIVET